MKLRSMQVGDWPQVARIYSEGMATGYATFEQELPDYSTWDSAHMKACRIVAESDGKIMGWVALSPVSSRCVYGGVGEISVYVARDAQGQGIGKKLMKELIAASEEAGLWSLQAGIFPENTASIKLHEQSGFRYIGKRERIGQINGTWKDNLLFERRSNRVGTDK